MEQVAREIVARCEALGFAAAGVARLEPSARADHLLRWLAEGRHGTMHYLRAHVEARLDPARVLPGARAAIVVLDLYATRDAWADPPAPAGHGRVARYARGRDYHRTMKRRLHALADELRGRHEGHDFRAFVDTAPVLERELAARAGLGWIAKNTMLIHPRLGSFTLIGGLLTTLELLPPAGQPIVADHCGQCTRCIDACPTGAITPYSVDARRCISYLTIERRAPIDPSLHRGVGEWVFGCDVCQEVCPHNSPRPETVGPGVANAAYEPRRRTLDLLGVLGWDEAARREALAGSSMTRATLDMLRRNAIIAAGNAPDGPTPPMRARIAAIADDDGEPGLVRDAARALASRDESGGDAP